MNLQLFAGGNPITRLYDFYNGQIIQESHLDGEFNRIHEWLNGKLGNVSIAADADIDGSKLKINTVPTNKVVGGVYTKTEVDTQFAAAALGQVPDRAVGGIKMILGTITTLELAPKVVRDIRTAKLRSMFR